MMRFACRSIRTNSSGGDPELLGRLGVDPAEAKHGGHDVSAFGEGGARGGRHVEIARAVDHDVAEDRLAAGLGLADDAGDAVVPHDRPENQECSRTPTPASATISL